MKCSPPKLPKMVASSHTKGVFNLYVGCLWCWCSAVSDFLQSCGLKPPRLLFPWDFPGKNTGVSCHFFLQGIFLTQGSTHLLQLLHWQADSLPLEPPESESWSRSVCLTLCDHMDYTVHGFLQARILECIAFPFSRASSQPRKWTQVSHTAGRFFTSWAISEAQDNVGNPIYLWTDILFLL